MSSVTFQYGSYSIIIPTSTIEIISTTINPHHSHVRPTSLTTENIYKRADGDSSSSSRSSRLRSSTTSKCEGDNQKCQTGSDINGKTVGLSVAIPVAVFLIIIGFFLYRSYKKGKKEAETDNDPDFYGETTILPDYPKSLDYDEYGNPILNKNFNDSQSYYSMNPFGNQPSSRYPSQGIMPPSSARLASERQYGQDGSPYYQNFPLPQQHDLGSKHSLDEFAKQTLGNEYSGYNLSRPSSRVQSRSDLLGGGAFYKSSANSSLRNLQQPQLQQQHTPNSNRNFDVESDINSDIFKDPVSTDTNTNIKTNSNTTAAIAATAAATSVGAAAATIVSSKSESPLQTINNGTFHHRQNSDLSFEEDGIEEEFMISDQSSTNQHYHEKSQEIQPDSIAPIENLKIANPDQLEEEDDEDIKRMKSVYRVYFDRENSIHGKKQTGDDIDLAIAPPLPNIEDSLPQKELQPPIEPVVQPVVQPYEEEQQEDKEEFVPTHLNTKSNDFEQDEDNDEFDEVNELNTTKQPQDGFLSVGGDNSKNHRAVSSIYSTIPLAQFDNNEQYLHQQQQQPYQEQYDQQYQQYPPQQYQQQQQQYPPQQYQQQQYQQQQYPQQEPYPQHQRQFQSRIKAPQYNDPEAPKVPNPSKMGYDSIINNTQIYAPTKALTGGSRPTDLNIKPFNPIDHSDHVFTPTSPNISSPLNGQFDNQSSLAGYPEFQQQPGTYKEINPNSGAPPSPHHIRQSIVMINPVEIGKEKIFRPAGSFTQYQQNSANSSRNGSMTSQSVGYSSHQQQQESGYIPHSGSHSDLRKQIGSSEDYKFV